jgi:hypothetical protein
LPKLKENNQNLSYRETVLGMNGKSEESQVCMNEGNKHHVLKKKFRIFKLEEADYSAVVTGCKPK